MRPGLRPTSFFLPAIRRDASMSGRLFVAPADRHLRDITSAIDALRTADGISRGHGRRGAS
jgi:hypothetical protein